ncbi:hypothetical protein C1646_776055 [Rhizophagus diaphanus]|nr:hypothetical protein C1646_776055 [Rhizophagus diaphanus] [Rhizophagus sp. MUCL 43196]
MQYTGHFNVKYKVQSQLLQKSNEDEHYCHTLFKYERKFNTKYRDYSCFISADDKHKVPIGEDVPVSTGQPLPPILSFYTDGGPDHRCTFGSVQIALICLFLADDFDMLIAVRTAPNHSWSNENLCLKTELEQCIKKVQELLRERTEHLVWKNEAFETEIPASDSEINEILKNNPDHYEQFANLYGKLTTEQFYPSLINEKSKTEPVPSNILISAKIRDYIRSYTYSCGSPIFPDNHICYWCGADRDFITPPQSLQEMFKLVYPLCSACYESGKTFYKRLENRVNRKVTKKQKTS